MPPQATDNYYVAQKAKLLRSFTKNDRAMLEVSEPTHGKDFADGAVHEALEEYEELIPQISYTGGRKNRLTGKPIGTAEVLATYKVPRPCGECDEEIGELVYKGVEEMGERYPRFLLRLVGGIMLTRFGEKRMRKRRPRLKSGNMPQTRWQSMWKAMARITILGLIISNFVMSKAFGLGLRRTMTIAEGCEKCDFRYGKGRETTDGWPPRFLVPNA